MERKKERKKERNRKKAIPKTVILKGKGFIVAEW